MDLNPATANGPKKKKKKKNLKHLLRSGTV